VIAPEQIVRPWAQWSGQQRPNVSAYRNEFVRRCQAPTGSPQELTPKLRGVYKPAEGVYRLARPAAEEDDGDRLQQDFAVEGE
jgi:hypothetical protein